MLEVLAILRSHKIHCVAEWDGELRLFTPQQVNLKEWLASTGVQKVLPPYVKKIHALLACPDYDGSPQ